MGGLRIEQGVLCGVALTGLAISTIAVGGMRKDPPGTFGMSVFFTVASEGVVVGPRAEVDGVAMPCHLGVEVEGKWTGVEAFSEERGSGDVASGCTGHLREANRVVVEWSSHGGAAAELPESAEEPWCTVKLAVSIIARNASLFDVCDEYVACVESLNQGGYGIALPCHHQPERSGVGFFKG